MKRVANSNTSSINNKKKRTDKNDKPNNNDSQLPTKELNKDHDKNNLAKKTVNSEREEFFDELSKKKEKKINYSIYYEYVVEAGKQLGICKLCHSEKKMEVKIARTQGNTKGLLKHLDRIHGKKFKESTGKIDVKQKKLTDMTIEVSKIFIIVFFFLCKLL